MLLKEFLEGLKGSICFNLPDEIEQKIRDYYAVTVRDEFKPENRDYPASSLVYVQCGLGSVDPNEVADTLTEFGEVMYQLSSTSVIELDDVDLIVHGVDSEDFDDIKLFLKSDFYDDIDFSIDDVFPHAFIIVGCIVKGTGSPYTSIQIIPPPVYVYDTEALYIDDNVEYAGINLVDEYEDEDDDETESSEVGYSVPAPVSEAEQDPEYGENVPDGEMDGDPALFTYDNTKQSIRCPKHSWVGLGNVSPYTHSSHGKHLGIKSKEICTTCGTTRWKNIVTGNSVNQADPKKVDQTE